ncbi:MAG: cytochrome c oxidase subunit II transmembrane domain-containing protein [Planctomycetota bacterium]
MTRLTAPSLTLLFALHGVAGLAAPAVAEDLADPAAPAATEPEVNAAEPEAAEPAAGEAEAAAPAEIDLIPDTDIGGNTFLPVSAATYSDEVDFVFYFILWVSIVFFVLIGWLLVYYAWKYRQRDKDYVPHGSHHNTPLELTWSIAPGILLLLMFIWGFRGYLDMSTPPKDAYPVTAVAWQWSWAFEHPNGYADGDLHVPAGTPILITNVSNDVTHSLYIPQFRIKKDVVPGRFNQTWFESPFNAETAEDFPVMEDDGVTPALDRDGNPLVFTYNVYDLFCTEYCGRGHALMNKKVYVHTRESFEKWMEYSTDITNLTPVKAGEKVWQQKCASCHSIDGSVAGGAPTWKDLWNNPNHMLTTGPIQVDEEYIYNSIVNPSMQVVQGYPANGMAPWVLPDAELKGLYEFMKSVSKYNTDPIARTKDDWKKLLPPIEATE